MESGDRSWSVIEPVCDVINIYDGPTAFLESIKTIPRDLTLLYASLFCEQEVCNGGFHQFFSNSTGVLAPEALEGLKAIGQRGVAHILEEAMNAFGSPYLRDRGARQTILHSISEDHFEELNRRFFGLIHKENGGFEAAADSYASRIALPD
jgi:hypothetical protein